MVRTLASHLAYYRRWARTWEFQALLKARPAAGDLPLAQEWIDQLAPLVWRAAERPEAVEDVRAMRRRIIDNVPPKELEREIKRGPGGLRDIEFAVQLLQLVHGRGDETLRVPGTIPALRALVAGGYVGRADGEALLRGYRFLRGIEHRLQMQGLRRTHTVPTEPTALRWLAAALGYTATPGRSAVESFRAEWVTHAAEVRRLHAKLLYRPLLESVARVPADGLRLTPEAARHRLEILGFADPAGALRHLQALTGGVSRTAAIQRTLLPVLLSEFADAPEPDRGLLNYRKVSDKLGSTPGTCGCCATAARSPGGWPGCSLSPGTSPTCWPGTRRRCACSPRRTSWCRARARCCGRASSRRRPATPTRSRPPGRSARCGAGNWSGWPAPTCSVGPVRWHPRPPGRRVRAGGLPGWPTSPVGTALADVTDATLAAALRAAQVSQPPPPGLRFAVIGMGRLGGYESNYLSDADVLFVYDPPPGSSESAASAAAHAIAEELRRLLGMPATDPPLGVDADLRPEGRQGPLVRSLAAYAQYYARWSRVWEAQALLRARFVCGDADLGAEFEAMVDPVRYPADGLTREQIVEIRRIKARVETERLPRGADPATHTKLGRGGLADVEWAVQLVQLRHAGAVPALRGTRTLDALAAAAEAGLVDPADAAEMAAGWSLAAQVRNALMLVRGRAGDQMPRHGWSWPGWSGCSAGTTRGVPRRVPAHRPPLPRRRPARAGIVRKGTLLTPGVEEGSLPNRCSATEGVLAGAGTVTVVHGPAAATVAPPDALSQRLCRTRTVTGPAVVARNVTAAPSARTSSAGAATSGVGSATAQTRQCGPDQTGVRYGNPPSTSSASARPTQDSGASGTATYCTAFSVSHSR
ncbi:hypothetical protein GCM10027614_28400 [Micromonospora vulcania]